MISQNPPQVSSQSSTVSFSTEAEAYKEAAKIRSEASKTLEDAYKEAASTRAKAVKLLSETYTEAEGIRAEALQIRTDANTEAAAMRVKAAKIMAEAQMEPAKIDKEVGVELKMDIDTSVNPLLDSAVVLLQSCCFFSFLTLLFIFPFLLY